MAAHVDHLPRQHLQGAEDWTPQHECQPNGLSDALLVGPAQYHILLV